MMLSDKSRTITLKLKISCYERGLTNQPPLNFYRTKRSYRADTCKTIQWRAEVQVYSPTNPSSKLSFLRALCETMNAQRSFLPFRSNNLQQESTTQNDEYFIFKCCSEVTVVTEGEISERCLRKCPLQYTVFVTFLASVKNELCYLVTKGGLQAKNS